VGSQRATTAVVVLLLLGARVRTCEVGSMDGHGAWGMDAWRLGLARCSGCLFAAASLLASAASTGQMH